MTETDLRAWKTGHVCGWLRREELPSLVKSFLGAKVDGNVLVDWPFSKLHSIARGETREIDDLCTAYARLMRKHGIARRFNKSDMRDLESRDVPSGFRSSGARAACDELGPMGRIPFSERSLPQHCSVVQGERSQWDFEQEFMEPSKLASGAMWDLPWKTFPFWRVGIELRRILMKSNFSVSTLTRLAQHYTEDIQRSEVSRDLLPLPLPDVSSDDEVDCILADWDDENLVIDGAFMSTCWWLGSECWLLVVTALLNFLHTGKDPRMRDLGVSKDKLNDAQKLAFSRLYNQIQRSIEIDPPKEFFDKEHSWESVLAKAEVDYGGEEVFPAQNMTWQQVKPALPKKGKAGAVRLLDICEGMMAEVVRNPEVLLKPKCEWKLPPSKPKVQWVESDDEWRKIVVGCAELGIFRFLKPDELLYVDGRPVRHNCLGVGKGKKLANGLEVLRMVFNLDLTNSMLRLIIADIRSLSYPGQWQAVQMLDPAEEDENEFVFAFSSADLTCAYFCFQTERSWDRYLAFEEPVAGKDVCHVYPELRDEPSVYACSAVLPMGFNSASSIMQYIHVRMATLSRPKGAGLSIYRQMRVDRPVPHDDARGDGPICDILWEVFQDNFDEAERIEVQAIFDLVGTLTPELSDMQDTYLTWGASRAEDKTFERVLVCESLGFMRDGLAGIQRGTDKAICTLVGLTAWAIQQVSITLKTLQVLSGRWCRLVQLRRELGCCLDGLWRVMGQYMTMWNSHRGSKWQDKIPMTASLREEFFLLLCSLPLMTMDLRLRTDPVVTASDASELGCGACRSRHLTPEGLKCLRSLKALEVPAHEEIGLVEIYAGIAGGRQALSLIGIHPGVHVMIETSHGSSRAALMAWPKAIRWSDVTDVDIEKVRTLLQWGLKVKLWIIIGGFPCLEYTALKAEREGHAKDWLVLEIARVAQLFVEVFPKAKVKRVYENVSSMCDTECEWITKTISNPDLKLDTLFLMRLDGRDMTPAARDRLYWLELDPSFLAQQDCEVEESDAVYGHGLQGHMYKVKLECKHPPPQTWLNAGSKVMKDGVVFPTFVKSMKRKRPPLQPAGIDQCDAAALERWKSDDHRFPPYQYLEQFLVLNRDGCLMTPDSAERERISMYPVGITKEIFAAKDRSNKINYEDARLCAIGEGFHCGVVAWLLNKALMQWGFETQCIHAQELVDEYFSQPLLDMDLLPECRHSNELGMARALVAYQCHVGGELRSLPGRQFLGSMWPRAGIPAEWWKWSTIISFPWHEVESINMLEARALLQTLRWRARSQYLVGSRCIHLLDSQVCLGALRKWRSPAPHFNRVITRIASLILASSCKVIFIYVPTEINPADHPSRQVEQWRSQGVRSEQ